MLLHMRAVLTEMSELADFHESLKVLKALIERQEKVLEDTKGEQKDKLKDKLKGLGL